MEPIQLRSGSPVILYSPSKASETVIIYMDRLLTSLWDRQYNALFIDRWLSRVYINKNILSAECKKADGQTWVNFTIDLDQHFGNIEGKFTRRKKGFRQSADSISVVDGLLIAQLQTSSGKYRDDQVDLDIFFHNNDGVLDVKPASTSVNR